MIIKETTLTGTEEELLAYFKEKYNLVEFSKTELPTSIPDSGLKTEIATAIPAQVGNKVTTGVSGLFDGTSWGKR